MNHNGLFKQVYGIYRLCVATTKQVTSLINLEHTGHLVTSHPVADLKVKDQK